jgi:hypothetical protein
MEGGEYRLKEDHLAATAKKQILIHQTVFVLPEGCSGVHVTPLMVLTFLLIDMLCLGRKLSFL